MLPITSALSFTHYISLEFEDGNRSNFSCAIEPIEGGYEARALGHSIFTEAETLEELRAMVRDAILCHFEDIDRPRVIRLHFVREEVLAA